MHSLKFNYLHDLATANYDLGNRPDPDSESIVLKEDLLEAFWGPQTNEARVSAEKNYGCGSFRDIEVPSGGQTILLSVDYLGPSVYWLKDYYSEHGVDAPEADSRIRAFLKESRKLGGHILFPRGSNGGPHETLNQARSGERGVYDRIDATLLCLKVFFDCPEVSSTNSQRDASAFMEEVSKLFPSEEQFKKVKANLMRIFDSLQYYAEDFAYSSDFRGFCERQKLTGSFVTKEGEVEMFAPLCPLKPENYEAYAENVNGAIKKRNTMMHSGRHCAANRDSRKGARIKTFARQIVFREPQGVFIEHERANEKFFGRARPGKGEPQSILKRDTQRSREPACYAMRRKSRGPHAHRIA